ncbi:MAG: creatininase family protein, partial [Gemmatimonadaceae bacterium]
LRDGIAWAPRKWTQVTEDTGSGDPAQALPGKGEKFLDAVTQRIASYLVDLDAADLETLYE